MRNKYDIVVIGAGPIGSYTAYQLADKGFKVCLIDEKSDVGNDVICAGVISKEAFKRYDLPVDSILSRIDSFTFVSPQGQRLEYTHPDIFAYVVDRKIFDQGLLKLAKKCGVDVYLNHRVNSVKASSNFYTVVTKNKSVQTRVVVIATGVNYELHGMMGLGRPAKYLYGSQIELPVSLSSSAVEIHIGRDFAPGSFGWVIPINNKFSRIGLIVENRGKKWLEWMIEKRLHLAVEGINKKALRLKPIAYGPIEPSVKNRALAVGEAAGQVKTTTGGGVFYGLLCSEIAVDKLIKTLRNGSDLRDYEVTWRSALISELDIGQRLREIARSLDDKTIDGLFTFVKQHKFWVELLLPRINFDYHSNLIFFCLKSFEWLLKS